MIFAIRAFSRLADLSRRRFSEDGSLGEGECSMKITDEVRKFAAEQKLSEMPKQA
jgi:hypothetical protein